MLFASKFSCQQYSRKFLISGLIALLLSNLNQITIITVLERKLGFMYLNVQNFFLTILRELLLLYQH
jgi:hypothetical protein